MDSALRNQNSCMYCTGVGTGACAATQPAPDFQEQIRSETEIEIWRT